MEEDISNAMEQLLDLTILILPSNSGHAAK